MGALEQRVQALEQEVMLLKAQIQATLLDMQEQLLNTKYPMLRPEESMKTAALAAPIAEAPAAPATSGAYVMGANVADAQAAMGTQMNGAGVKRVVLSAPEENEVVDVRRMSGAAATTRNEPEEEIRVQPVVRAKPNGHRPMPDEPAPEPRRSQAEASRFSQLDWDEDEVELPPTRKPRATEAPRATRTAWDDSDELEQPPTRPSRPTEAPRASRSDWEQREDQPSRDQRLAEVPRRSRSDWEIQPQAAPEKDAEDDHDWIELENWVSQKVEKLGITRTRELINIYTRQERFSRQERDLLLQFVSVYDGVPKASSGATSVSDIEPVRPTIVPQTRAVVDEIREELRQKRAALKQRNDTYRLSEQQELVMRLIAGILSTGDDPASGNGQGNH